MGVTEQFSDWIVSATYETIPKRGIETVKRSLLDWIGCALLGSTHPATRIVAGYTQDQGGTPQARLVASGSRTASTEAAFANGVMGHVEDFDDSGAHPASYLTPTVLALGEELHLSGKALLTAWAIGYEVSARIAAGLHPERGWHTTAIYGTLGATAAASKLLGLSTLQTRMAFGIGASETAGLMRNFATMTKSFHPANAARSAIVAAKLAARGFSADPDIIEARYGYADCFGGEKCNLGAMTQFLGVVYFIESKGPEIKAWPCCSSNHAALTAIMKFIAEHAIDACDIVRVEHHGPNVPGTGSLQRRTVRDGMEGKFCLEYNIAAAFIDRKVDLATFSEERVHRGDLQEFMKKVERYQDAEAALHSGRTRHGLSTGRLRVALRNGTVYDLQLGSRTTLTGDAVVQKFRSNAIAVLDAGSIERVITLINTFDDIADTSELMDALCPS